MTEHTTTQPRRLTNIQLAAQVSRDVELDTIQLRNAQLEAADDLDQFKLAELGVEQKYRADYRIVADPSRIRVTMEFLLDLKQERDPHKVVLHLAARYALTYRIPEGREYGEPSLRWFADLNAAVNAWPYWRELVHTVAARVGLGSITLPVFRATPKEVDDQGNVKEETREAKPVPPTQPGRTAP